MKNANDFCYWLQGHFELRAGPPEWAGAQSQAALCALDRALKGDQGADPGRPYGFCNWMLGFAAAAAEINGGALPKEAVAKIQARLDLVFEHALPPKEQAPAPDDEAMARPRC